MEKLMVEIRDENDIVVKQIRGITSKFQGKKVGKKQLDLYGENFNAMIVPDDAVKVKRKKAA